MNNEHDTSGQAQRVNRRQAIVRVTALLGGAALVGGAGLWAALDRTPAQDADPASAAPAPAPSGEVALLDEIAETILPATKTPGAKAAGTGAFMALMVADCYSDEEQQVFRAGMDKVEAACQQAHGTGFLQATPEQRLSVLTVFDTEQHQAAEARAAGKGGASGPPHFFRMMKELALLGYFTSEIGYKQAMRYAEVPGRYDPCLPYTAGETSWASHA